MAESRFDAEYYARYYEEFDIAAGVDRLVRFVAAYLDHLDVGVEDILDFGCGQGTWKEPLAEQYPAARYVGVEVSEHACERYGWIQGSIVDYDHGEQVDLVVCQGVLQYLDDAAAEQAILNLARHTRGAMYLEALTQGDWDHNCDQSATDGNVHLRPVEWYRERLGKHFINCGGGVFVPHDNGVVLFELEHAP